MFQTKAQLQEYYAWQRICYAATRLWRTSWLFLCIIQLFSKTEVVAIMKPTATLCVYSPSRTNRIWNQPGRIHFLLVRLGIIQLFNTNTTRNLRATTLPQPCGPSHSVDSRSFLLRNERNYSWNLSYKLRLQLEWLGIIQLFNTTRICELQHSVWILVRIS